MVSLSVILIQLEAEVLLEGLARLDVFSDLLLCEVSDPVEGGLEVGAIFIFEVQAGLVSRTVDLHLVLTPGWGSWSFVVVGHIGFESFGFSKIGF